MRKEIRMKYKKTNKKKIFLFVIIIIIISLAVFFLFKTFNTKTTKKINLGNNSTSQEIVDYILDISSYEAIVEVEVNSNKNNNKYELKQQFLKPNISAQEVIKPEIIQGIRIIKNDKELKIENSKLNLSTIINKYKYMTDNVLDLNTFIETYKKNEGAKFKENDKDNEIIMNARRDNTELFLYINREKVKPTKMEIKDNNKNNKIYIVYKEITFNNLEEKNILAFEIYENKKEV